MPVRLHGHFGLESRGKHKLQLLLSKGEENAVGAICLAAANGQTKTGHSSARGEVWTSQGRDGFLAGEGATVRPSCAHAWEAPRSTGHLSLAGMSLVLCFTAVVPVLSSNSVFPAKRVTMFCRLHVAIPFLF